MMNDTQRKAALDRQAFDAWMIAAETFRSSVWLRRKYKFALVACAFPVCGLIVWSLVSASSVNLGMKICMVMAVGLIGVVVTGLAMDSFEKSGFGGRRFRNEKEALMSSFRTFIVAQGVDVPENARNGWKFDPDDVRIMTKQVSGVIYACSSLEARNEVFSHRSGGGAKPIPGKWENLTYLMRRVHQDFNTEHPDPTKGLVDPLAPSGQTPEVSAASR